MKYAIVVLILFSLFGCDYEGYYTFKVKNETSKKIELRFKNDSLYYSGDKENRDTVYVQSGEEKAVIVIYAPLNSQAHDCLHEHGMTYFKDLVFDTYVDTVKIEKQLWQPDNWTYRKCSKWSAEYKLSITDELLQNN